jgi:hypothetical protein
MPSTQRCRASALVAATLLLLHAPGLQAQTVKAPELSIPRIPRVSQGAESRQIVGLSDITITYHRPGVKGRTIWGGLLPYDEVWRAGANEPTLITFSDPVAVNGQKLDAGSYRFLVIPSRTSWTLIFNSETKQWGSVYDSTFDVLKLAVTPESGPRQEWMSFSFDDLTSSSARVVLAWEKVRVSFVAEFATMDKLASSLGGWRILNQAARYAMNESGAEIRALEWVDQSLACERNGANTRTKAEILARQGKYPEAIALAEESIALSRAQNPNANVDAVEKMIAEWKSKK